MKSVCVIICAAGASARFGGKRKKPFVEVGGRAAFLRSMEFFVNRDEIKQMLVAINPDDDELVKLKWGANLSFCGAKLCHGGKERFETVANALEKVKDEIELVAVHDAVRCCLKDEWIDSVIEKAGKNGAAMLACPVIPTIKKVKDGKIVETVDRTGLFEAQTPQVFDKKLLKDAYAGLEKMAPEERKKISDDAMLIEMLGKEVSIVETDNTNLKITKKSDVPIAEAIIKSRPKPKPEGPIGPYIEAQW